MKRAKKSVSVSLVLVPALLSIYGCSYDPSEGDAMQRDVYTKFEDCVADWGKPELCQGIAQAEAAQLAQSQGVNTGGGVHPIFWGPSYYPSDRAVSYNGQTYAPTKSRAMSKPFMVTPTSSASAKSSPGTARATSVSRGGFGSFGRSAGASSFGG